MLILFFKLFEITVCKQIAKTREIEDADSFFVCPSTEMPCECRFEMWKYTSEGNKYNSSLTKPLNRVQRDIRVEKDYIARIAC